MKTSSLLRSVLLAGVAVGLACQPFASLRADNHRAGGGGDDGGRHGGGDDGGGTNPTHPEDHGRTEFLGTVQTLPATVDLTGIWTVDGRAVVVTAATLIRTEGHGAPVVGGRVEVEGVVLADGSSVQANSVKTEDAGRLHEDNVYFGPIQELPASGLVGTWRVAGLTVLVTNATRLESEGGSPAVGLNVRVEGVQGADASITASEVKVLAAGSAPVAGVSKHKGLLQQLPDTQGHKGNWLVGGVVVTVTDDSVRLEGSRKAKLGRKVVVKGQRQINGTILASKLSVPGER